MLHGDMTAAVGWNGFAIVVDAFVVIVIARFVWSKLRGHDVPVVSGSEGYALGGVAAAFFVARNLPWFQPELAALLGPPGWNA